MTRAVAIALAGALAGAAIPARADDSVWAVATRTPDQLLAARSYAEAMMAGDDALALAAAAEVVALRARLVDRALRHFAAASAARPEAIAPHVRAASALQAFFVECRRTFAALCGRRLDAVRARALIAEWDAIERKAPLDPRLTEGILFDRAILHTKLDGPGDLEAARDTYQRLLDRLRGLAPYDAIGDARNRRATILGNLAETHMMLGDLEASIEAYRLAEELDPDVSRGFGLAVALDRDDQGEAARQVLRGHGDEAFARFIELVASGRVFFVPDGEVAYYLGMGAELAGDHLTALEHFEEFVRSGAHPRYQRRAREHIAALRARLAAPGRRR